MSAVDRATEFLRNPKNIQGKNALSILLALQVGSYGGQAKLRAWSHTDQITLATGVQSYNLFDTQEGGTGKPAAVTNNPSGGDVSSSTHYTFDAVELTYNSATPTQSAATKALLDQFLNDFRLQLTINELAPEHQFYLSEVFGNNLPLTILGTGVGDQVTTRNNIRGIRSLMDVPVVLAALTTYTCTISSSIATDAALNGDTIKVTYKGYKLSSN